MSRPTVVHIGIWKQHQPTCLFFLENKSENAFQLFFHNPFHFDVQKRKAVKVRVNWIFICVNSIHNAFVNPELSLQQTPPSTPSILRQMRPPLSRQSTKNLCS